MDMNIQTRICFCCANEFNLQQRSHSSLQSHLKRLTETVTVGHALQVVLGCKIPVAPEGNGNCRDTICAVCTGALRLAYKHTLELRKLISSESVLQGQLNLTSTPHLPTVDKGCQTDVQVIPQIPIGMHMKNSLKNKRKRQAMLTTINRIVSKELQVLTRHTILATDPPRDDVFPPRSVLENELEQHSPTIHTIFKALFTKSNLAFSPQMRVGMGLAVNCRNHKCNAFQKAIGMKLWETKASIKTYDILNNFGISTSYKTIVNTLDTIRTDYDRNVLEWKENVTAQLMEME